MSRRQPERLAVARLPSPIGEMLLVVDESGTLRALDFYDFEARMYRLLRIHYGASTLLAGQVPRTIANALARYFKGDLTALREIPWDTAGTQFQCRVWSALTAIEPGSTTTYGTLARKLGVARASRAVGLANGSNPISIVIPCHRVVGADGSLTGYGGGLHRKEWLLAHEHAARGV
jgi:methylated-DNA-[protein]-cysteine S-methyltransferase